MAFVSTFASAFAPPFAMMVPSSAEPEHIYSLRCPPSIGCRLLQHGPAAISSRTFAVCMPRRQARLRSLPGLDSPSQPSSARFPALPRCRSDMLNSCFPPGSRMCELQILRLVVPPSCEEGFAIGHTEPEMDAGICRRRVYRGLISALTTCDRQKGLFAGCWRCRCDPCKANGLSGKPV